MLKNLFFSYFIFSLFSSSAFAHHYSKLNFECKLSGSRQTLSGAAEALEKSIKANYFAVYDETGKIHKWGMTKIENSQGQDLAGIKDSDDQPLFQALIPKKIKIDEAKADYSINGQGGRTRSYSVPSVILTFKIDNKTLFPVLQQMTDVPMERDSFKKGKGGFDKIEMPIGLSLILEWEYSKAWGILNRVATTQIDFDLRKFPELDGLAFNLNLECGNQKFEF